MSLFSKTTTTTSKPVFTTDQQSQQHNLSDALGAALANPTDIAAKLRAPAADRINRNYESLNQRLQRGYSGRGFGNSGRLLTDQVGLEMSRNGDLGQLESDFASKQLAYESDLRDQSMRFAFSAPGQQQTQETSGGWLGDLLSQGLGTATTLFGLNALLKSPSRSGGGSAQFPN